MLTLVEYVFLVPDSIARPPGRPAGHGLLHLEPLFSVYACQWHMPGIYHVYVDLPHMPGIYMVYPWIYHVHPSSGILTTWTRIGSLRDIGTYVSVVHITDMYVHVYEVTYRH
jgi:hypothetical protein